MSPPEQVTLITRLFKPAFQATDERVIRLLRRRRNRGLPGSCRIVPRPADRTYVHLVTNIPSTFRDRLPMDGLLDRVSLITKRLLREWRSCRQSGLVQGSRIHRQDGRVAVRRRLNCGHGSSASRLRSLVLWDDNCSRRNLIDGRTSARWLQDDPRVTVRRNLVLWNGSCVWRNLIDGCTSAGWLQDDWGLAQFDARVYLQARLNDAGRPLQNGAARLNAGSLRRTDIAHVTPANTRFQTGESPPARLVIAPCRMTGG